MYRKNRTDLEFNLEQPQMSTTDSTSTPPVTPPLDCVDLAEKVDTDVTTHTTGLSHIPSTDTHLHNINNHVPIILTPETI